MIKENVSREEMVRVLGENLVQELENKSYDEKDEFNLDDFSSKNIWIVNENHHKNIMGEMRKDDKTNKEIYVLVMPNTVSVGNINFEMKDFKLNKKGVRKTLYTGFEYEYLTNLEDLVIALKKFCNEKKLNLKDCVKIDCTGSLNSFFVMVRLSLADDYESYEYYTDNPVIISLLMENEGIDVL